MKILKININNLKKSQNIQTFFDFLECYFSNTHFSSDTSIRIYIIKARY